MPLYDPVKFDPPPPVVGYVSGGRFKLDLRTVFPRQDLQLIEAIRSAL